MTHKKHDNTPSTSDPISKTLNTLKHTKGPMDHMKGVIPTIPNFSAPGFSHSSVFTPESRPTLSEEDRNEYRSASAFMRALAHEAMQWKEQLPENFTPAILAILYGGIQIHVSSLSKVSFDGIRVEGTMNGSPCSVLAHQSTVQMLCYGEEINQETPKNPIGFIWDQNSVQV